MPADTAAGEIIDGVRLDRDAEALSLTFAAPWQSLSSAVINGGRRHARSLIVYRGDVTSSVARTLRAAAKSRGLPPMTVGVLSPCEIDAVQVFTTQTAEAPIRILSVIGGWRPADDPVVQLGPVVLVILVRARLSEAAAVELAATVGQARASAFASARVVDRHVAPRGDASTDALAILWRKSGGREIHHAHSDTDIGIAVGRIVDATVVDAARAQVSPRERRSI